MDGESDSDSSSSRLQIMVLIVCMILFALATLLVVKTHIKNAKLREKERRKKRTTRLEQPEQPVPYIDESFMDMVETYPRNLNQIAVPVCVCFREKSSSTINNVNSGVSPSIREYM